MPYSHLSPALKSGKKTKIPRIISMFTNKGGVGKTTALYHLGASLVKLGMKVLLIDADSQCNLSKSFLKYKINFEDGFCPFENEEDKRQIFRHLSRKLLSTDLPEMDEVRYRVHFMCSDSSGGVVSEVQLKEWEKEKDPKTNFLLYFSRNQWFIYAASKATRVFKTCKAERLIFERDRKTNADLEISYKEKSKSIVDVLGKKRLDELLLRSSELNLHEKPLVIFFILCSLSDHESKKSTSAYQYAADYLSAKLGNVDVAFCEQFDSSEAVGWERAPDCRQQYCIEYDGGADIPGDGWTLRHIAQKPTGNLDIKIIEIRDVPGLEDFLKQKPLHDSAEELEESDKRKIKSLILGSRHHNLSQFLNTDKAEMVSEVSYAHARRTSLLSIKPPQDSSSSSSSSSGATANNEGELLLLPGSADFQLYFDQRFSNATLGIKDDRYSAEKNYIYEVNAMIRYIAEMHDVDFVMMDLNPSSSNINQVFLMLSDAFFTTVNTEEYSDDAMLSLSRIVETWSHSFERILKKTSVSQGYPLINTPPAFLGMFFQKLLYKGTSLKGMTDKMYAAEILENFKKEVIPALKRCGMYPSCGLPAYEEIEAYSSDGEEGMTQAFGEDFEMEATISQEDLGIHMFSTKSREMFKLGMPVVWNEGDKNLELVKTDFRNVLKETLSYFVVNTPSFSDHTRSIFLKAFKNEVKRDAFCEAWSSEYYDWLISLNSKERFKERFSLIKDPYYRLSFIDMLLMTTAIKRRYFHTSARSGSSEDLEVGSVFQWSAHQENALRAVILQPTAMKNIAGSVKQSFSYILKNWKSSDVKQMLIPFFFGSQWFCLRILFDKSQGRLSILLDDPRGRIPMSKSSRAKRSSKDAPSSLQDQTLLLELGRHIHDIKQHYELYLEHYSDHCSISLDVSYKPINQQGDLSNDVGSGPVVLANIEDYLRKKDDGSFYSNQEFCDHSKERYLLPLHTRSNPSRKSWQLCTDETLSYRSNLASYYNELFQVYKGLPDYIATLLKEDPRCKRNVKKLHDYCRDYVKRYLACLTRADVNAANRFFEKKKEDDNLCYASKFLSLCFLYTHHGARNPNRTRVNVQAGFSQACMLAVWQYIKKSGNDSTLGRRSPVSKNNTVPKDLGSKKRKNAHEKASASSSGVGEGKPKTKRHQKKSVVLFAQSKARKKPVKKKLEADSSASKGSAQKKERKKGPMNNRLGGKRAPGYIRHTVAADGDCGYTAFGITRDEALSQLLGHIEPVKELLQPAIREALLTDRFYRYLIANNVIRSEVTHKNIIQTLEEHLSLTAVYQSYLTYDVRDKHIDAGYAHPGVLQALAHIRGVSLRMWRLGDNTELSPNRGSGFDYFEYISPNDEDLRTVDILFINNNHFDLLESSELNERVSEGDKPICPPNSSSSRNKEDTGRAAQNFLTFLEKASGDIKSKSKFSSSKQYDL